jgi:hypothetical protein
MQERAYRFDVLNAQTVDGSISNDPSELSSHLPTIPRHESELDMDYKDPSYDAHQPTTHGLSHGPSYQPPQSTCCTNTIVNIFYIQIFAIALFAFVIGLPAVYLTRNNEIFDFWGCFLFAEMVWISALAVSHNMLWLLYCFSRYCQSTLVCCGLTTGVCSFAAMVFILDLQGANKQLIIHMLQATICLALYVAIRSCYHRYCHNSNSSRDSSNAMLQPEVALHVALQSYNKHHKCISCLSLFTRTMSFAWTWICVLAVYGIVYKSLQRTQDGGVLSQSALLTLSAITFAVLLIYLWGRAVMYHNVQVAIASQIVNEHSHSHLSTRECSLPSFVSLYLTIREHLSDIVGNSWRRTADLNRASSCGDCWSDCNSSCCCFARAHHDQPQASAPALWVYAQMGAQLVREETTFQASYRLLLDSMQANNMGGDDLEAVDKPLAFVLSIFALSPALLTGLASIAIDSMREPLLHDEDPTHVAAFLIGCIIGYAVAWPVFGCCVIAVYRSTVLLHVSGQSGMPDACRPWLTVDADIELTT